METQFGISRRLLFTYAKHLASASMRTGCFSVIFIRLLLAPTKMTQTRA